jgi:hypothetical protein
MKGIPGTLSEAKDYPFVRQVLRCAQHDIYFSLANISLACFAAFVSGY